MSDATKNLFDVFLAVITMAGAAVAFFIGWMQWRRGQEWQRAEQLDKFIRQFESDELLKLATVVLDWKDRAVKFRGQDFKMRNRDVLLALRKHQSPEDPDEFPGEQPTLRDAYDALLAFFNRLEIAIKTELIDSAPAKAYFAYWLERLVTFDQHTAESDVDNGADPAKLVAKYISAYSDEESIKRLCKEFEIEAPAY
jgi:hypothetical protein